MLDLPAAKLSKSDVVFRSATRILAPMACACLVNDSPMPVRVSLGMQVWLRFGVVGYPMRLR